jgi:hypothetical protein
MNLLEKISAINMTEEWILLAVYLSKILASQTYSPSVLFTSKSEFIAFCTPPIK